MPQASTREFFRPKHIVDGLGIAESTLYLWIKEGKFPQPIKLNGRVSLWKRQTILDWLEDCERVEGSL